MKTFADLNLIPPLQRAVTEERYQVPTPIQAQTIPPAMRGHDILGCAQTGTGKTAAFALPILNRIGSQPRKAIPKSPYVLVLAPTRELAIQIGDNFGTYGKHLRFRKTLVYGGVSQVAQVRALHRGVHVLIATPGRLLDLMGQGHIRLDQLNVFVLDEADRMLDMGFLPDLKRIISKLPEKRQSLFFSATMPPKIIELTDSLLRNPVKVDVTPKVSSVKTIRQELMFVEKKGKEGLLRKILASKDVDRALVFTKTKRMANTVAERLASRGVKATAIHGNKSQNARQRALDSFRKKQVRVLVATDVAARGIDIDNITHVINFDLPVEAENYVHRIGRTGRAGAGGVAISFCSSSERNELRAIERFIGQKVPISPDQPKAETVAHTEKKPSGHKPKATGGQKRKPARGSKSHSRSNSNSQSTSKSTPAGAKPRKRKRKSRRKTTQPAIQTQKSS